MELSTSSNSNTYYAVAPGENQDNYSLTIKYT